MCSAVAALSDAHVADLICFLGLSAHKAVGLVQRGTAESPLDTLIDGVRSPRELQPCTRTGCHANRWPTRRRARESIFSFTVDTTDADIQHSDQICIECNGEHHAPTTVWFHGLFLVRGQVHHHELVRKLPPPRLQD